MEEKNEPKMVPVDITGHPLPNLTPEQHEQKKEKEFDRLMKTANKGIYNKWTRQEKLALITWAQNKNYDLSLSEFKDIVDAFIRDNKTRPHYVVHSLQKIDGTGRELDVLCMNCGRIHTFDVPVAYRAEWEFDAPCVLSLRPETGKIKVDDTHLPVTKWELTWLGKK